MYRWIAIVLITTALASAQDKNEAVPPPELKPRPAEIQLPTADTEVHILRGKTGTFTTERMNDLYFAACRGVAAKVHPDWPLDKQTYWLRPKFRLTIGARADRFTEDVPKEAESQVTFILDLKQWDEGMFVAAVVVAATDNVLSQQQKKLAVAEVLLELKADPRYFVRVPSQKH